MPRLRRRRATLGLILSIIVAIVFRPVFRRHRTKTPSLLDDIEAEQEARRKKVWEGRWYEDPKHDPDPFSYKLVVRDRTVRMLFMSSLKGAASLACFGGSLTKHADSLTRVDTFLYELYGTSCPVPLRARLIEVPSIADAAQRNPYILPYFWGPGYKGYDEGDNLRHNLDRHFGCGFWEIVLMHQGASSPCHRHRRPRKGIRR